MEKEKAAYKEWSGSPYNIEEENCKKFAEWAFLGRYIITDGAMAAGFYGGYHSRDKEIERLKAEIERKDSALRMIANYKVYGPSNVPYLLDVARNALDRKRNGKGMKSCIWAEDEEGLYETSCGNCFYVADGEQFPSNFNYCIYCGKELTPIPYFEEDDDD